MVEPHWEPLLEDTHLPGNVDREKEEVAEVVGCKFTFIICLQCCHSYEEILHVI